MSIEQEGNALVKAAVGDVFELRFWQDGTLSDVGIRPRGETADAWLPLQLKHSKSSTPAYHMRSDYGCFVLATHAGRNGAFVFTPDNLKASDFPESGRIKISLKRKYLSDEKNRTWRELWCDWNSVIEVLLRQWHVGASRRTERELRMQVNASNYIEWLHIDLARRFEPEVAWSWPVQTMQLYDQLRAGEKVQFKSTVKTTTGFEASNLHKKMMQAIVPYELGDNDWYYFSHIVWEHRLFIQWRIPEAEMLRLGLLSVRDATT